MCLDLGKAKSAIMESFKIALSFNTKRSFNKLTSEWVSK